jgi:hypothetical protein
VLDSNTHGWWLYTANTYVYMCVCVCVCVIMQLGMMAQWEGEFDREEERGRMQAEVSESVHLSIQELLKQSAFADIVVQSSLQQLKARMQ